MYELDKLDEARHFLTLMIASAAEPKAFRYELSAFLSAARSALQYALKEAKAKPGGQAWYDKQVSGNAVVEFFKDKRDINIHQQPLVPATSADIAMTAMVHLSSSLLVKVIDQEEKVVREVTTTPKPAPPCESSPPVISYRHTFADWTGPEDVLALCSVYLSAVEAVVNDGVTKGYLTKLS